MGDDHFGERCPCCNRVVRHLDGIYEACDGCAWCQSLGQCFEGEDLPENTICCHGKCREPNPPEIPDSGKAVEDGGAGGGDEVGK